MASFRVITAKYATSCRTVPRDQREVCLLAHGMMFPVGAIPIHSVTEWLSLFPSSSTDHVVSTSHDGPSCCQEHGRLTTFRICTVHGVGPASSPVALLSASRELRTLEPATYPLVKPLSIFGLVSITTFISDLLPLTIPCIALAPNRLMLAVVISPRGSMAALAGVATLSQAHLIQRGLGTGGRTPGKSLLS